MASRYQTLYYEKADSQISVLNVDWVTGMAIDLRSGSIFDVLAYEVPMWTTADEYRALQNRGKVHFRNGSTHRPDKFKGSRRAA